MRQKRHRLLLASLRIVIALVLGCIVYLAYQSQLLVEETSRCRAGTSTCHVFNSLNGQQRFVIVNASGSQYMIQDGEVYLVGLAARQQVARLMIIDKHHGRLNLDGKSVKLAHFNADLEERTNETAFFEFGPMGTKTVKVVIHR